MPGEWSKEVGEYGEKVISRLLDLFGWKPYKHPVQVPCHRPDLHKLKTDIHGLDYLKYYDCPLYSNTQKTVAISAKYYEAYPSDPTAMAKKFIMDLGKTMHCLKLDKDLGKFKINQSMREIQVRGVLFYLNHTNDFKENMIKKIGKFRNSDPVTYEPIFIVDNNIATFLYSAINHFKSTNPDSELIYSYPCTEQNIQGFEKITSGKTLPLEFFVANMLPVKVEKNGIKKLFLYLNDSFSKENLSSIIGFCHQYTNGWANEIIIHFTEYRELHNNKDVSEVFTKYSDQNLTNEINIKSFNLIDFRELEEN